MFHYKFDYRDKFCMEILHPGTCYEKWKLFAAAFQGCLTSLIFPISPFFFTFFNFSVFSEINASMELMKLINFSYFLPFQQVFIENFQRRKAEGLWLQIRSLSHRLQECISRSDASSWTSWKINGETTERNRGRISGKNWGECLNNYQSSKFFSSNFEKNHTIVLETLSIIWLSRFYRKLIEESIANTTPSKKLPIIRPNWCSITCRIIWGSWSGW